jgi:hypothetical protein
MEGYKVIAVTSPSATAWSSAAENVCTGDAAATYAVRLRASSETPTRILEENC